MLNKGILLFEHGKGGFIERPVLNTVEGEKGEFGGNGERQLQGCGILEDLKTEFVQLMHGCQGEGLLRGFHPDGEGNRYIPHVAAFQYPLGRGEVIAAEERVQQVRALDFRDRKAQGCALQPEPGFVKERFECPF